MITLVGGDLYQWDTGRMVQVEPNADVVSHEVHFSNDNMDFAYVVKTHNEDSNTYCRIPDVILQTDECLYCYEVCKNANGEETTSMAKFKVKKRNRPDDYVYTETEVLRYENLEKRINALEQGGGSGVITEGNWEKVAEIPMNTETVIYELASTNDYHDFIVMIRRVKITTGSGNVFLRLASEKGSYVIQNTNLFGSSFGYTNGIVHLSIKGDIIETIQKISNNMFTGTPTYSIYEGGEKFRKDSKLVLVMSEEWAQATSDGDTIIVYGGKR